MQLSTSGLRLRTEAFDAWAVQMFGESTSKTQVAERLGTDKATLSLYRNHRRTPSRRFVNTVLALPGAAFDQLFEYGPADDRQEVSA